MRKLDQADGTSEMQKMQDGYAGDTGAHRRNLVKRQFRACGLYKCIQRGSATKEQLAHGEKDVGDRR